MIVQHEGIKLQIGDHMAPEIIDYIRRGDYERRELKAIRAYLEPDDVVIELGAGIGFISLQCARIVGGGRVFAFEANPKLEPHIRRNFQLNDLYPTLQICILGEQLGQMDFFIDQEFWGSSTVPLNVPSEQIRVPVRPLNDEIHRIGPTFLIADIEGGEYDLLKTIDFHSISKVSIELHKKLIGEEKVEFIKDRLHQAGFVIDPEYSRKDKHLVGRRRGT
jgi:FkbM family methyltransferase